jgi:hypothetical protein
MILLAVEDVTERARAHKRRLAEQALLRLCRVRERRRHRPLPSGRVEGWRGIP